MVFLDKNNLADINLFIPDHSKTTIRGRNHVRFLKKPSKTASAVSDLVFNQWC